MSSDTIIRPYRPGDESAASDVCLRTGDHGADGTPFYQDDPDALARIYVFPYLEYAPHLALMLEDAEGVCGYAMAVEDSRAFFDHYERVCRPRLCERFPAPTGPRSSWSRVDNVHWLYHHPDYHCPEPYAQYPSHLHIDLLPRAQGKGRGRRMIETLLHQLRVRNSPGVHLGMSALNTPAYGFYRALGFAELDRDGEGVDEAIYLGMILQSIDG